MNFFFGWLPLTLHVIMFFFGFFVPSDPPTHSQVHTQINKPEKTKIKQNINGFDMAKSAAQLLYGPVLV